MITLSEAYRKLNNKNTRRRVNEAVERDIPAQFRKYYKISDYEPSGGEYEVGDRVGEFEIAAYLEPKAQYDRIEIWPFLLKSKDGYMVAEVAWDRVYPVNIDEVTMYLDESTRRPTRRRRVNESMDEEKEIREAVETMFMDFIANKLTKEMTAKHYHIDGKPIIFDTSSFVTTYYPYFMEYLNASMDHVYKKNKANVSLHDKYFR